MVDRDFDEWKDGKPIIDPGSDGDFDEWKDGKPLTGADEGGTSTTTTTTTTTTSSTTSTTFSTTTTGPGDAIIWAPGGTFTDRQDWQNANRRVLIANADITGNATSVRFKFIAHSTQSSVIDGASIGPVSSAPDYSSAPTRITFDTGSSTVTLTAGTAKWSDWITFTIDEDTDYLVHTYSTSGGFVYCGQESSAGHQSYLHITSGDDTMTEDVTMTSNPGAHYFLSEIEGASESTTTTSSTTSSTYSTTTTTAPGDTVIGGTLVVVSTV